MLIIGLTGGMGSGKSTTAHYFSKLGIEVLDTDKVAHLITEPDQPALKEIIKHFGEEFINEDGQLNRKKLRTNILSNLNEKKWLESLLHPLILKEIKEQLKKVKSPYCLVVIPLLFEVHLENFVDRVLVIDTSEENQMKRTFARGDWAKEEIEIMMHCQVTRSERTVRADDMINNDGSLEELEKQVQMLHQKYLSI